MSPLTGYCERTRGAGNCTRSSVGSWPLARGLSWAEADANCTQRCRSCEHCAVVSFSPRLQDCSWYAHCDETALFTDVSGFRTVRLRPDHVAPSSDDATLAAARYYGASCRRAMVAANVSGWLQSQTKALPSRESASDLEKGSTGELASCCRETPQLGRRCVHYVRNQKAGSTSLMKSCKHWCVGRGATCTKGHVNEAAHAPQVCRSVCASNPRLSQNNHSHASRRGL